MQREIGKEKRERQNTKLHSAWYIALPHTEHNVFLLSSCMDSCNRKKNKFVADFMERESSNCTVCCLLRKMWFAIFSRCFHYKFSDKHIKRKNCRIYTDKLLSVFIQLIRRKKANALVDQTQLTLNQRFGNTLFYTLRALFRLFSFVAVRRGAGSSHFVRFEI